jgi:hypothetical protein
MSITAATPTIEVAMLYSKAVEELTLVQRKPNIEFAVS